MLAIKGRIYPATGDNVALEAILENGRCVLGETKISRSRRRIESVRLRPRRCRPLPDTLAAIAQADVITLGPGIAVHQRHSEPAGGTVLRKPSGVRPR